MSFSVDTPTNFALSAIKFKNHSTKTIKFIALDIFFLLYLKKVQYLSSFFLFTVNKTHRDSISKRSNKYKTTKVCQVMDHTLACTYIVKYAGWVDLKVLLIRLISVFRLRYIFWEQCNIASFACKYSETK